MRPSRSFLTVVETLLFQKQWPLYWTEEERGEFAAFIAERPGPRGAKLKEIRRALEE